MNLKQEKVSLKAKRDLEMVQMFGKDVSIKEGDILDGLIVDLQGTELIGVVLNGVPNYYYGNIIREEFDLIENTKER